jgi:acyl carrier protein
MTRDRLVDALRAQLTDYLYFGEAPSPIAPDEDLFELGLDSQGVTRLVAWIERELAVAIPPEEVTVERFGTLDALADLVSSRA